jgi:hypothetical protein
MVSRKKKDMNEKIKRQMEVQNRKLEEHASKYLLTTSAEAYVGSVGKELSDFDLRSVDIAYVGRGDLDEIVLEGKRRMIQKAQDLVAEVVVDLRNLWIYSPVRDFPTYMMGTALIPKIKK